MSPAQHSKPLLGPASPEAPPPGLVPESPGQVQEAGDADAQR